MDSFTLVPCRECGKPAPIEGEALPGEMSLCDLCLDALIREHEAEQYVSDPDEYESEAN